MRLLDLVFSNLLFVLSFLVGRLDLLFLSRLRFPRFLFSFHGHRRLWLTTNDLNSFLVNLLTLTILDLWLGLDLNLSLGNRSADLIDLLLEPLKSGLILHKHDLQVVIGLVVVSDEIVDGLHETAQGLAVVFSFEEELLLGEHSQQVEHALASVFTKGLGVRSQVRHDGNDTLVDRLE